MPTLTSSLLTTVFTGGIQVTIPQCNQTIPAICHETRTSEMLKAVCGYIRRAYIDGDEKAVEDTKKNLPYFIWSGQFSRRKNDCCESFTGVVACDVDKLETTDDAKEMRDKLKVDPHIAAAFLSPSGHGIKFGILTDATAPQDYKAAWVTARAYLLGTYGIELDPSGCDISRACFASHDPDAWCAESVEPLAVIPDLLRQYEAANPTKAPVTSTGAVPSTGVILKDRHQYLMAYQGRMAHMGMGLDEIVAASRALVSTRFDLSDGRQFPDDEIIRGAKGAVAKFMGGDVIAAQMHGAEVANALIPMDQDPETEGIEEVELASDVEEWPKDLLEWPGVIGQMVKDMLHGAYRPQAALAVGSALCECGAVLGHRVSANGGRTRTNLYIMGLCETAGGKDVALQYGSMLFNSFDRGDEYIQPDMMASGSALMTYTHMHPTAIWIIDEFGQKMAKIGSPRAASYEAEIQTHLLKLYSQANGIYRGIAKADEKEKPKIVNQPCVCLYGTGNHNDFFNALNGSNVTNGFLPRFILVDVDDNMPTANNNPPPLVVSPEVSDWFLSWSLAISALQKGIPFPTEVPYSPAARALANKQADTVNKLLKEADSNKQELSKVLLSRVMEKASRIALIRACAQRMGPDKENVIISEDDVRHAFDFVMFCTQRTLMLSQSRISDNDEEKQSKDIERFIRSYRFRGVRKSALLRKFRAIKARDMDAHLEKLTNATLVANRGVMYYTTRYAPPVI